MKCMEHTCNLQHLKIVRDLGFFSCLFVNFFEWNLWIGQEGVFGSHVDYFTRHCQTLINSVEYRVLYAWCFVLACLNHS